MALESKGRVVLKIFGPNGLLLIARPCTDQSEAETYFAKYRDAHPLKAYLQCEIIVMVPRI